MDPSCFNTFPGLPGLPVPWNFQKGKGDGNVRYFEMVDDKPWAFSVSEYRSSTSAKGMAMIPKRCVNVMGCEIARLPRAMSTRRSPCPVGPTSCRPSVRNEPRPASASQPL